MKPFIELDSKQFAPERRAIAFRDVAAHMCLLDVTPNPDIEFESVIKLFQLPELQITRLTWSPTRTSRSTSQAHASGDNVIVHIPLSGQFRIHQAGGKEATCVAGDVYIDPTEVHGVAAFEAPSSQLLYLSVPREKLEELGGPVVENALREKLALNGPWQLLLSYALALTSSTMAFTSFELERCSLHIHDLLALALGARKEVEEQAKGRGLRAARLQGIKQQIEENLGNPALSSDFLSQRCGISPRYIRALFADEHTTLSDYVQNRRLERAYGMLTTNPDPKLKISDIAYAAGFGDLSWFNNSFKKRYGLTPREARALSFRSNN